MLTKVRIRRPRLALCKCTSKYMRVKQNQSLSPTEMNSLRLQGKPISSFFMPDEVFNDGTAETTFDDLLTVEKRGVDIEDIWNEEKDLRKKVSEEHNKYTAEERKIIDNYVKSE